MKVIVSGASGLVGKQLMQQLLSNDAISKVLSIGRTASHIIHPKLEEYRMELSQLNNIVLSSSFDAAFCCVGTTLKKAGSKAKQYEVDHDYVVEFAALSKRSGVKKIGIVSSLGADAKSKNFYLKTKGQMELDCVKQGFEKIVFVRPSLLLGERRECRIAEQVATKILSVFKPILKAVNSRYTPVNDCCVAKSLIAETLCSSPTKIKVIESEQINTRTA